MPVQDILQKQEFLEASRLHAARDGPTPRSVWHREHKRPPCTKAHERELSVDARTSTLQPSAGQQAYQRIGCTPLSHLVQPYAAVVQACYSICCRECTLQSPGSYLEAYIVILACKRDTFGFRYGLQADQSAS